MENEVKVLKLVTGEEIITTLTQEGEKLHLKSPMRIHPLEERGNDSSGFASQYKAVSIVMVAWSFTGITEEVTLNSEHVLAVLEALPDTVKEYNTWKSGQDNRFATSVEQPTIGGAPN